LPANERKINASLADTMLFDELPKIVRRALKAVDREWADRHVETAERAEYLRGHLARLNLVAFVAGGSFVGMGIPRGVTLIVGGGFHAKSTLLQAVEQGIYNHIAGNGREMCVTSPSTMKIRGYSGRSVTSVNIS
jgi:predicted ABC-class ATPase